MTVLLMIGTAKRLFPARREGGGDAWRVSVPHFPTTSVHAVGIDTRGASPRVSAGVESSHFGPGVAISDDLGGSRSEPQEAPVAFPKDTGESLKQVWALQPGPASQPSLVWAGSQHSALFRSTDGGVTYGVACVRAAVI